MKKKGNKLTIDDLETVLQLWAKGVLSVNQVRIYIKAISKK